MNQPLKPWYKEPWPWVAIAIPGAAVIMGDPEKDKSEGLFRALGRFIGSLGGRYITAEDSGTSVEDMHVIGERTMTWSIE